MFGFLRGNNADRGYRQVYAGCCAYQHSAAGVDSLLFLSYESVLLYLLAIDAGVCERPEERSVACCRLRTKRRRLYQPEPQLAEFCVNFGLLLASIKLDDDVRDQGSLPAVILRRWFASRFRAAREYFSRLDTSFAEQIETSVADHVALERSGRPQKLTVYAEPTSRGFGSAFRAFATMFPSVSDATRRTFEQVGEEVGLAIIAHDCAVDWPIDKRRGRYNPLPSCEHVEAALITSQQALAHAGWMCRDAFGEASLGANVFAAAFRRSTRRKSAAEPIAARRRLPRRLVRAGMCDCDIGCCDLGCCDGGDAPASGCQLCSTDSDIVSVLCCCDPCCFCDRDCKSRSDRKTKSDNQTTEHGPAVGMSGRAVSPLKPNGVVEVGGKRLPAKSQGDWIDAGVEVEVVAADRFGVTVRAIS